MDKFLLFAVCGLLMLGCRSEVEDYFPLRLGSTWNYVVPYEGLFSVEIVGVIGSKYIVKAQSDESLKGVWPFSDADGDTETYYAESGDTTTYGGERSVVLIRPLETGVKWSDQYFDSVRVLGKEKVTVPAGGYENCARVAYFHDGKLEWYLWFAQGVGIIKGYDPVYDVEYDLISADIPPGQP
ncbi:hypothetical protein JXD38_06090 [candidate division WOR-3 bacterium]|nr:hypothetical protein [candidate division WOR-3 bacterium]